MIIDTDKLKEAIIKHEESHDFEKMTMAQLTASETRQLNRLQMVNDVVDLMHIDGIFKQYAELLK